MADARSHAQGPLRFADLIRFEQDDEAALFWDKTRMEKITARDDDQEHIVRDFDRHDVLAVTEIGSTRVAHLIMDRNETAEEPMRLWPNDFYPGRRIQIPTTDGLRERDYI